jgi:hypothetical protein
VRLAFICSSLEIGRDGVGDYSRRLAGEIIRQGNSSVLVGLNDLPGAGIRVETQEIEGAPIPVLRLPSDLSWGTRTAEARKWLDAFDADWVSLQYVPFGFHPKGLCFGLGKTLSAISPKAHWHFMFHELWLGLGRHAPVKDRIYGVLQRRIVLQLFHQLRPQSLHTHADPYRRVLTREGAQVSILPLFSGVPVVEGDGWQGLVEPLASKAAGKTQARNSLYLAGIFGGVHPEWNVAPAVNALLPLVHRSRKRLVLVFLGKNNLTQEAFNKIKLALQDRADVIVMGERTNEEISRIMQTLDFGLATSPRQMIQKSSSAAAMLEHGLRLLVTRDDWRLRESDAPPDEVSDHFLTPKQLAVLEALPVREHKPAQVNSLERVAGRMLDALNSTRFHQGGPARSVLSSGRS